jgi:hypothetical protein
MTDEESPIRLVMVGDRRFPRYAIAFAPYPFLARLYWSGAADAPWIADDSGAMRWADFALAEHACREIVASQMDDLPGAR